MESIGLYISCVGPQRTPGLSTWWDFTNWVENQIQWNEIIWCLGVFTSLAHEGQIYKYHITCKWSSADED